MDAGANATFQMRLDSSWETPMPRSYFSCADITYVEREGLDFPDAQFPCINTTDTEWEDLPTPTKKIDPPKSTATPWSPIEKEAEEKKLDSGVIAGISIGCAIAVMAVIVITYSWRDRRRRRREREQEVPCIRVPGSYGLPDVVPVRFDFYGRPTRRG
jgi:hypothetical protein